jgi:osomolarity two-component system, phosphorelay intermediate protein YPD1
MHPEYAVSQANRVPQAEDFDFGDNVDLATFEQILDMDEEPSEREFSQGIVFDFFNQAEGTFADMDMDM